MSLFLKTVLASEWYWYTASTSGVARMSKLRGHSMGTFGVHIHITHIC